MSKFAEERDRKTLGLVSKLRHVIVKEMLQFMLSPMGGVGLQTLAKNGGVHWSLVAAPDLSLGVWDSLRVLGDEEYLR